MAKSIAAAGAKGAWVGVWDPKMGTHTVAVGEAAPGRPATVDDNWRMSGNALLQEATQKTRLKTQLLPEGVE